MTNNENHFHQIANNLANAIESKMFGALSIKANNGKNAAFYWKENMVFKLDKPTQREALSLEGACIGSHIYAPEKQMKGWIMIPNAHLKQWAEYAEKAVIFVNTL